MNSNQLPVTESNKDSKRSLHTYKYIYFHNDTDLPVLIESWVDGSSSTQIIRFDPKEKKVVHSSVGEWHIISMFDNKEDNQKWKDAGLKHCCNIGKFRSRPCASNCYYWLDYTDTFSCNYTDLEDDKDVSFIKGLITFYQVKDKKV